MKDPTFASRLRRVGRHLVYLAFSGRLSRDVAYRSAKGSLTQSVELDDSIGKPTMTLGVLNWRFDWDWEPPSRVHRAIASGLSSQSARMRDRRHLSRFYWPTRRAWPRSRRSTQLDSGPMLRLWLNPRLFMSCGDYPSLIDRKPKRSAFGPE